jgi:hypothetical protein
MAEMWNFVNNLLQTSKLQKNGGLVFYCGFKTWLLLFFVLFVVLGLFYQVHVFCINYKINVIDSKCAP